VRVVWSPLALERAEEAARFIAADKPLAAAKWAASLLARVGQLEAFPESGRVVPEFGRRQLRELVLGGFRVIYRTAADRVEILTVRRSDKLTIVRVRRGDRQLTEKRVEAVRRELGERWAAGDLSPRLDLQDKETLWMELDRESLVGMGPIGSSLSRLLGRGVPG
jgi:toxin ParE1/3/4